MGENDFALSLSYPKPIISFARNNKLLDKMPFCHLTQYCRSKTAVDIARIIKVSTSPVGIKYKFGIQVPKEINNSIELDKKDGNKKWQEAIKIEFKKLTDYQTFIELDSGEDIQPDYQKIPYHMVFDGNWFVNKKEDIYPGVFRMSFVRVGFFLGDLYGLSYCACDIRNAFLNGKNKREGLYNFWY
jgi:hypothetical protein